MPFEKILYNSENRMVAIIGHKMEKWTMLDIENEHVAEGKLIKNSTRIKILMVKKITSCGYFGDVIAIFFHRYI